MKTNLTNNHPITYKKKNKKIMGECEKGNEKYR